MNNGNFSTRTRLLLSGLILAAGAVHSMTSSARSFGPGAPQSLDALPSGKFRSAVEALPEPGRRVALQWLQSIEFTSNDVAYMHVDKQGAVYYADTFNDTKNSPADTPPTGKVSKREVFNLHSFPGARNKVFIDFDGATVSGTAWNVTTGAKTLEAPPYDTDGKPDRFSDAELAAMKEIWQQVAEDFAPFKVDVTTEDPGTVTGNTGWILVTRSDGRKASLPDPQAGGVGYINTLGFSKTSYYSPAFVYTNNLGSSAAVAGAISHGMGHLAGLSHDGAGAGKGEVSWAPIMGMDPGRNVTQWSKSGVNHQDDIAILTGRMGLRGDDHDDTRFDKGTPLVVDAGGRVSNSSHNSGVIEDSDDVDVFVFNAGAGNVDLSVAPAWQAFSGNHRYGGNLDVHLALYDTNGKRIAETDPRDSTAARLRTRVPGGRYVLEVDGVSSPSAPDSDYGSLGHYYISGNVPAGGSKTALR